MTLLNISTMAGAILILALVPGPGVFATISRALASGFRQAAFVVGGIVIGDLIFLLFAAFGLSALATSMGEFFTVVKYAGAAYLLWIGFGIYSREPKNVEIKAPKGSFILSNFLSGLTITLSNPKVILFYLGFLPTFVDLQILNSSDIVIMISIISTILGSVMLIYAYMASKAKEMINSSRSQRYINRVAGTVMMSTGLTLIAKS